MYFLQKCWIFSLFVAVICVTSVVRADTILTSNTYLGTRNVNGIPLTTQNGYFYGASSTAAATAAKEVTISSIDAANLSTGQVIVVTPANTSTATTAHTLRLNPSQTGAAAAKPIYYNGAAVNTAELAAKIWAAGVPATFVYDGTNWVFAGSGGETGETYSAFGGANGSVAGTAGLVPAPAATDNTKFLRGDGSWAAAAPTVSSADTGTGGYVVNSVAMDSTNPTQVNVTRSYVKIPVAAGAPSTNTPTGFSEIWLQ